MKVYPTQESCLRGCKLQRYDKSSHIEIRVNSSLKNTARPQSIILCRQHLNSILNDPNHQFLGFNIPCALCGTILDQYRNSVDIDLNKIVAPPFINEPIDYILYNFKALATYISQFGHDHMISEFITSCASYLESTPYKPENISVQASKGLLYDNIGSSIHYADAIEWFIDAVSDVNYSGADKMTIYGITYSDLKLMVLDSINQYGSPVGNYSASSNHPYWNNISTSSFVVHGSCVKSLLDLDWNNI